VIYGVGFLELSAAVEGRTAWEDEDIRQSSGVGCWT